MSEHLEWQPEKLTERAEKRGEMLGAWVTKAEKREVVQWAQGHHLSISAATAYLVRVGLDTVYDMEREVKANAGE